MVSVRAGRMAAVFLLLAASLPPRPAAAEAIRVAVIGDSLTSGFQLKEGEGFCRVLERYARARGHDVAVFDHTATNDTTQDASRRIGAVLNDKPDIVLVALGMNDALRGNDPMRDIHYYLVAMLMALEREKVKVVFAGIRPPSTMSKLKARELYAAYHKLVKEQRQAFYPDLMDGVSGHPELLLEDRFHPNARGVRVMVQRIFPTLEPLISWRGKVIRHHQNLHR